MVWNTGGEYIHSNVQPKNETSESHETIRKLKSVSGALLILPTSACFPLAGVDLTCLIACSKSFIGKDSKPLPHEKQMFPYGLPSSMLNQCSKLPSSCNGHKARSNSHMNNHSKVK